MLHDMNTPRVKKVAAVLGSLLLAARCGGGPTGPASQPPSPPPIANPVPPLETYAGVYTLTIDVPDQCSGLQDAVRRRTYQATLKPSPFRYLVVEIVGGGFSRPVVPGELWPGVDGQLALEWNSFDIGGCDGYFEPLSDGRSMMICGVGAGVLDGSTITVGLSGEVFIQEEGRQRRVCQGRHQFTFTRSTE